MIEVTEFGIVTALQVDCDALAKDVKDLTAQRDALRQTVVDLEEYCRWMGDQVMAARCRRALEETK